MGGPGDVHQAVLAAPEHTGTRALLADALEQLGFAAESATWRNAYLYAAQELRDGKRALPPRPMLSPALVAGLTTDLLFDYLAVRLNPAHAEGTALTLVWHVTDRNESYALTLRNSVLAHRAGEPAGAGATLTTSRHTLEALVLGLQSPTEAQEKGDLTIDGDPDVVARLFAMFDAFPLMFDVVG